ncbi:MAG TPA: TetR/AcrR family transcriptional regulator [Bacillota bacterium]|nr:TetR/AcrR family transcriptional regulator [Bacillota bacterium]
MERKNIPDAKNRILQAAVKVFAEKSFEGSRIDEVAREAGVPKSLIYYHFKSKNEIFEVLISNFIQEFMALLQVTENNTHQSKADKLSQWLRDSRAFGEKNADLVRIMFIESLKKSNREPIVFKVVEAMVAAEEKLVQARNPEQYNRNERLVTKFFTGLIPNYAYLCFAESWTQYFGVERKEFDGLYAKIMTTTHEAYHREQS